MKQFLATFFKDLLILWRDRAGMLVLFVMPMALVLVVSLVQNNVLEATGRAAVKVLLVDVDQGHVGQQVRQRLADSGGLTLIETIEEVPLDEVTARQLVAAGDYQFGLLIPTGISKGLQTEVEHQAEQLFRSYPEEQNEAIELRVKVFFDPTVQGVFRTAVLSSIRHALFGLETAEKGRELSARLKQYFGSMKKQESEQQLLGGSALMLIDEESAGSAPGLRPNAVQQNIPAWSLFGMFFIVVPLSGALLRERQEGTLRRLLTLPVPYWALLAGKTMAYVTICMVQFCLMLLVGKYILPLFGTPVFELGNEIFAVFLLAFCAALAATGYGLLIGTLARSFDQAAMFGAVSVVIAAALGGIMIPVYVMPKGMQLISQISPLAWGLEGFLELFVRGGSVQSVESNLLALFGFFVVTTLLSLLIFTRRGRSGG
jgi:ABC-2 type transport system permease protein